MSLAPLLLNAGLSKRLARRHRADLHPRAVKQLTGHGLQQRMRMLLRDLAQHCSVLGVQRGLRPPRRFSWSELLIRSSVPICGHSILCFDQSITRERLVSSTPSDTNGFEPQSRVLVSIRAGAPEPGLGFRQLTDQLYAKPA